MWVATLFTDSRRTCFITIPQKWGVNFSQVILISQVDPRICFLNSYCRFFQMVTIKIQQSNISTPPVYATCIGDNGLTGDEYVVIGTQFARLNGLDPDVETAFEIFPKNIPILSSVIAEPCKEEDWELLVIFIVEILFWESLHLFLHRS